MLEKIDNFTSTEVARVILIDNFEDFKALSTVMVDIGLNKLRYAAYKDSISYMLELRMPYEQYLEMIRKLQKYGYALVQTTKINIFNQLTKIES